MLTRMDKFRAVVQGMLWTASYLPYFMTIFAIVLVWLVRKQHVDSVDRSKLARILVHRINL